MTTEETIQLQHIIENMQPDRPWYKKIEVWSCIGGFIMVVFSVIWSTSQVYADVKDHEKRIEQNKIALEEMNKDFTQEMKDIRGELSAELKDMRSEIREDFRDIKDYLQLPPKPIPVTSP